jgi:hypothetical protein
VVSQLGTIYTGYVKCKGSVGQLLVSRETGEVAPSTHMFGLRVDLALNEFYGATQMTNVSLSPL